MATSSIRTSIDLPSELHHKLDELAERKGCSAPELILQTLENAVNLPVQKSLKKRLSLDPPLVPSTGKPISLTEEQLYGGIEFP